MVSCCVQAAALAWWHALGLRRLGFAFCLAAAGRRRTQMIRPRLTRVGACLRQTSLDELPQVWKVLTSRTGR
jgi:lipopolysaccharide/colanic/teichoic acid biosynthesis glycosyltransferase